MRKMRAIHVIAVLCLLSVFQVTAHAEPAYSTANTSIADLIDNPQTRPILDKFIPGFSTNPALEPARGMTLQAIKPFAADTITDDVLAKIDADLAKLPAPKK
ncbi:MAG TPA: hypothetical protein VLC91_03530 [Spongiibacteraceae bacterium]|nr:hypothetical protein [Spongiibacteraceae bacterium]